MKKIDFICNLCGQENIQALLSEVENREFQSCKYCGSSLRMRSLMFALSKELYGKVMTLPEFPVNKKIKGVGLSDWEGYSRILEDKFNYTNTYYHKDPMLDIVNIKHRRFNNCDFIISSDVYEHIPMYQLKNAFSNTKKLLKNNGIFLLTVPFTKTGSSQEHFPTLFDYKVVNTKGKYYVVNRNINGDMEVFEDLIFHGGPGSTLEMRIFSEPDLLNLLGQAGFSSHRICQENYHEYGIVWPMDWAVPVVAR